MSKPCSLEILLVAFSPLTKEMWPSSNSFRALRLGLYLVMTSRMPPASSAERSDDATRRLTIPRAPSIS